MTTRSSNSPHLVRVLLIVALLVAAVAAVLLLGNPKSAAAARAVTHGAQPAFIVQIERQLQIWDRDWARLSPRLGAEIRAFFSTRNPTWRRDWQAIQTELQKVRLYLESLWQQLTLWWRQTLPRLQRPVSAG